MSESPKRCPFCGREPSHREHREVRNFEYGEGGIGELKSRPLDIVKCVNTHCPARPQVTRGRSLDAVQMWNVRA